jgi:hypothetical protein
MRDYKSKRKLPIVISLRVKPMTNKLNSERPATCVFDSARVSEDLKAEERFFASLRMTAFFEAQVL